MYTLWFQKPYGINEPTIIGKGIAEDVLAFIVASSQRLGQTEVAAGSLHESRIKHNSLVFWSWISPELSNLISLARGLPIDPIFQYYGVLDTSPQIQHHSLRDTLSPFFRCNEMSTLRNMDDPRLINHLVAVEERAVITSKIEPDMIYYGGEEIGLQYHPCNSVQSEMYLSSGQALRSGLGPRCIPADPQPVGRPDGFNIGLSEKDIRRLDMAGAFINNILSSADQNEESRRLLLKEEAYSTTVPFDPLETKYINPHGTPLIYANEKKIFPFLVLYFGSSLGIA